MRLQPTRSTWMDETFDPPRPTPPARAEVCGVCGGRVREARTTEGEVVTVDAVECRAGTFVLVASTPDVLGRRPLLVVEVVGHGGFAAHRCALLRGGTDG